MTLSLTKVYGNFRQTYLLLLKKKKNLHIARHIFLFFNIILLEKLYIGGDNRGGIGQKTF